jgi:hypothetical protein
MPSSTTTRRLVTVMAAVAATTAFVASPSLASGGGGVSSSGPCSTVSGWTMQAQASGTSIEVRAAVFTNQPFSTWTWKLLDNGGRFARGTGVADRERHDLAFFQVRRTPADQRGSDAFRFRATNTATGEVCDGSLTF